MSDQVSGQVEYTAPEASTQGVGAGWAEPVDDPTVIPGGGAAVLDVLAGVVGALARAAEDEGGPGVRGLRVETTSTTGVVGGGGVRAQIMGGPDGGRASLVAALTGAGVGVDTGPGHGSGVVGGRGSGGVWGRRWWAAVADRAGLGPMARGLTPGQAGAVLEQVRAVLATVCAQVPDRGMGVVGVEVHTAPVRLRDGSPVVVLGVPTVTALHDLLGALAVVSGAGPVRVRDALRTTGRRVVAAYLADLMDCMVVVQADVPDHDTTPAPTRGPRPGPSGAWMRSQAHTRPTGAGGDGVLEAQVLHAAGPDTAAPVAPITPGLTAGGVV